MNAATVALNRGAFERSARSCSALESDDATNDHVQYMLCVAHTLLGDTAHALDHLS